MDDVLPRVPGDDGGARLRVGRQLRGLDHLDGLHHLTGLGVDEVLLYVESDNAPEVAVYSRLGFGHADADTHVQYRRP